MDREQILEDLKEWAGEKLENGENISPYELIEKINELEEIYE